ncbi:hypothetical protein AKO1_002703 [Acrasis kona]|uniref:Uncharacterized protein n=1 Tax=Acrasis kona TaxID=1008807 RepID=A0AAW2ZNE8_9EUKA
MSKQNNWVVSLKKGLIDSQLACGVALLQTKNLNEEDTKNKLMECIVSKHLPDFKAEMSQLQTQKQFINLFGTFNKESKTQRTTVDDNDSLMMIDDINDDKILQIEEDTTGPKHITLCGARLILLSRPIMNAIVGTSYHKRYSVVIYRLSYGMILIVIFQRPSTIQKVLHAVENVCSVIND